jgi:ribose transport system permease protein
MDKALKNIKKVIANAKPDSLRNYAIIFIFVFLIIFFGIASPHFIKYDNLFIIARQVTMLGITAVGMTFVMISGGIDLSVGSVLSLVSVVCAKLMVEVGLHPIIAVLLALIMCVLIGATNGFFINKLNIPPMIVTLGTMTVIRGISYILCDGRHIWGFPEGFRFLGQGYLGPVPIPVIVTIIIFIVGAFLLNRTAFGRWTYGLGDNEEATRLSGINVKKMKYLLYILSSTLAGIAGLVLLSRMGSGQPKVGTGFELEVVTAVALGGVSVYGGEGKLRNAIFGVLIIGILENGMILLNVSDYFQQVIIGLVLLAAVGFDNKMSGRLNKE